MLPQRPRPWIDVVQLLVRLLLPSPPRRRQLGALICQILRSSSVRLRRPLLRLDPKTLFLDHNAFSCNFPPSILKLRRIFFVDLSHNNLSSALPPKLAALDRLYSLRFDRNRFTSNMPPLNQSSLKVFNVSQNNLNGSVPDMTLLAGFGTSAFVGNPGLCGEVVHKQCNSNFFFTPSISRPWHLLLFHFNLFYNRKFEIHNWFEA